MTNDRLRAGQLGAGMTRKRAAEASGVSVMSISEPPEERRVAAAAQLARELSGLGYPGFSHLRSRKAEPAVVVLQALLQKDLETRAAEALPWVLLRYPDMDWTWVVRHAKLHDVQNRLGFLVALAKSLATGAPEYESAFTQLSEVERSLERVRLEREDTLCRESMPAAERKWLKTHRSALARDWNLLTGLTADQLPYGR